MNRTSQALNDVLSERTRQEKICAAKRAEGFRWLTCADDAMSMGEKLPILLEEVGEVAQELNDARDEGRPIGPNLRVELIQVAAVAVAWAESLDNRPESE